MRDQQKIPQQRLGPLQEEEAWVIGELSTVYGRVKQAAVEEQDKITNLIVQGVEEIIVIEATVIKEVEGAKVASQNFIYVWKSE